MGSQIPSTKPPCVFCSVGLVAVEVVCRQHDAPTCTRHSQRESVRRPRGEAAGTAKALLRCAGHRHREKLVFVGLHKMLRRAYPDITPRTHSSLSSFFSMPGGRCPACPARRPFGATRSANFATWAVSPQVALTATAREFRGMDKRFPESVTKMPCQKRHYSYYSCCCWSCTVKPRFSGMHTKPTCRADGVLLGRHHK